MGLKKQYNRLMLMKYLYFQNILGFDNSTVELEEESYQSESLLSLSVSIVEFCEGIR